MINKNPLILPIIFLVLWSLVLWVWMGFVRIPNILKLKIRLDKNKPWKEQMSALPPSAQWKADNYNNLMEQPTVFYAIVFCLILLNDTQSLNVTLAWLYVFFRVIHSLMHVTVNKIKYRFAAFLMSGIMLTAISISTLIVYFKN